VKYDDATNGEVQRRMEARRAARARAQAEAEERAARRRALGEFWLSIGTVFALTLAMFTEWSAAWGAALICGAALAALFLHGDDVGRR